MKNDQFIWFMQKKKKKMKDGDVMIFPNMDYFNLLYFLHVKTKSLKNFYFILFFVHSTEYKSSCIICLFIYHVLDDIIYTSLNTHA